MATLGSADDSATANGEAVLKYGQAVERALAWKPDSEGFPINGLTVRQAVEQYLDWYRAHRKAFDRIRYVFDAHIFPELGNLHIDALTTRRVRRWHRILSARNHK